jgi:hypothetical protein
MSPVSASSHAIARDAPYLSTVSPRRAVQQEQDRREGQRGPPEPAHPLPPHAERPTVAADDQPGITTDTERRNGTTGGVVHACSRWCSAGPCCGARSSST